MALTILQQNGIIFLIQIKLNSVQFLQSTGYQSFQWLSSKDSDWFLYRIHICDKLLNRALLGTILMKFRILMTAQCLLLQGCQLFFSEFVLPNLCVRTLYVHVFIIDLTSGNFDLILILQQPFLGVLSRCSVR